MIHIVHTWKGMTLTSEVHHEVESQINRWALAHQIDVRRETEKEHEACLMRTTYGEIADRLYFLKQLMANHTDPHTVNEHIQGIKAMCETYTPLEETP